MGYKKRGYDRDTPNELLRDYKLFAIACEGSKREPDYFNVFQYISKKIKVDLIQDYVSDEELLEIHDNRSAPKWVLDKAMKYIEKNDLKDEDDLWFVIDKDRWSEEQIRTLAAYCDRYRNWNLVISNPCFEIWLYFHNKSNISLSSSLSCTDFKKEIYAWLDVNAAGDRKPGMTDEQFYYKVRKNAIGPFKAKSYALPAESLDKLGKAWEAQFDKLFNLLGLKDTKNQTEKFIKPVKVAPVLADYVKDAVAAEDVSDLSD
ncbi:MAG TPA: RloB family protein [Anaerolineales bacterium]|nr:RloB family protein [Anaerolineales bacterium]